MAIVYPTSDLIGTFTQLDTASTPALSNGDTLLIAEGISIISTNSTAISAIDFTSFTVVNSGTIAGDSHGVRIDAGDAGFTHAFTNTETGVVLGGAFGGVRLGSVTITDNSSSRINFSNMGEIIGTESAAVKLTGAGTAYFDNSGHIGTDDIFDSAVEMNNIDRARIDNSGTIFAANDFFGAAFEMGSSVENVILSNSGTMTAFRNVIESDVTLFELFKNSGVLNGDVIMSNSVGGTLQNSGQIFGDVEMRGGNDNYRGYIDGFVSGTVSGGAGDDVLIGSSAGDLFNGGADRDILRGKTGDDTLIGGGANDRLYGDEGSDELNGGGGTDVLFGGDGDDLLSGNAGVDVLFGGVGSDTFIYNSAFDSANGGEFDRIRDFVVGEDKIDLTAVTASGIDFVSGAFTGTGPEVRVQVTSTGLPIVFVDTNGDATANLRINLIGTEGTLTENDFIL